MSSNQNNKQSWMDNLAQLAQLQDDWCDLAYADKPHPQALVFVRQIMEQLQSMGIFVHEKMVPELMAGPLGEIDLQWPSLGIGCDVDPDSNMILLRFVNACNLIAYDKYKFDSCSVETLAEKIKQRLQECIHKQ